jgi:hypothetical protein
MIVRKHIAVSVATLAATLCAVDVRDARAAACCPNAELPSSGSCSAGGVCFSITNSSSGDAIDVTASGGSGVYSTATTGTGLFGNATTGIGVVGTASGAGGVGVKGTNTYVSGGTNYGVYGSTLSGYGVYGSAAASTSFGVYGANSSIGVGVYGASTSTTGGTNSSGVLGVSAATSGLAAGTAGQCQSSSGYGVYGQNSGGGIGVYGAATSVTSGLTANGVYGTSGAGFPNYAAGVYGGSTNQGYGVHGVSTGSGTAIYGDNTDSSGWSGYFNGRVNVSGNLVLGGTCTGTTCSSDIRLKKNVQSLAGSLNDLVKIRPVTFEWKNPEERGYSSGKQLGFIAQEVEKVKPEWVGVDDQGFKTLNTTGLQVMLVDSVRELKMENDELRERVKSLEAGRRPLISGVSQSGIGLGLLALAGAVVVARRKRLDAPD